MSSAAVSDIVNVILECIMKDIEDLETFGQWGATIYSLKAHVASDTFMQHWNAGMARC